jgi:hypothetical protein
MAYIVHRAAFLFGKVEVPRFGVGVRCDTKYDARNLHPIQNQLSPQ